ncbi:MAG: hypothetical protein M2R46_04090 [Verrucomicrobia subdivision 3 bacterium]|nr:hypothetical protein [Limisphaerales bacterium]
MAQPLCSRHAMEGTVSGLHKSPHRGSSVEFAEYRQYVPGDDLRRLDWRVLARTDRYYLKEFEAETNLRAYFALDLSGSMQFGSDGSTKLAYAQKLLATLAYLVIRQGDAAGLLGIGSKTVFDLPPRRNPAHLQLLLDSLPTLKSGGGTGLVVGLHELAEMARRRALVIAFSDCFCDVDELMAVLQHLCFERHDVVIFHILDPQEISFKFDRPLRFIDLEGLTSLVTEPSVIRDEYLRHFRQFMETLQKGCREFSIDYRRVLTTDNYETVLADFLIERSRMVANR